MEAFPAFFVKPVSPWGHVPARRADGGGSPLGKLGNAEGIFVVCFQTCPATPVPDPRSGAQSLQKGWSDDEIEADRGIKGTSSQNEHVKSMALGEEQAATWLEVERLEVYVIGAQTQGFNSTIVDAVAETTGKDACLKLSPFRTVEKLAECGGLVVDAPE